jgi:hypothetical protein
VSAAALDRAPLDGATPAGLAVAEAARAIQPIGLDELTELAELQARVDRKYLHPELPSNPWHPTLRRYFEPLAPDAPGAPTPRLLDNRDHRAWANPSWS